MQCKRAVYVPFHPQCLKIAGPPPPPLPRLFPLRRSDPWKRFGANLPTTQALTTPGLLHRIADKRTGVGVQEFFRLPRKAIVCD